MSQSCSVSEEVDQVVCLEKEQQTRAILREKFLRCVSSITGRFHEFCFTNKLFFLIIIYKLLIILVTFFVISFCIL